MLHIKFTDKPFDKLKTECAVITLFSDKIPFGGNAALLDWRFNGRLSQIFSKHRFSGKFQEALLMPSEGRVKSKSILVLGLGTYSQFYESDISSFTDFLLKTLSQKRVGDFIVSFSDIFRDLFEWRNNIRLLVSKLYDYQFESIFLCEPKDCIQDAKKRHMDFGSNVDVSFELNTF